MSQAFLDALQGLAAVEPARCAQPWSWEGRQGWPLAGRQALYLCLEAELGMAARREPGGEAAAAVRFAQTAFGDLRGLLAGVADSFLDSEPEPGAWTLRQVLGHVLLTERSYHRQVDYALRRADTDPIYLARASQLAPDEEGGGVRAWIDRLEAERALAAGLARTAVRLERPTQWAGYEVDVRFRLHRFTSHLIEHTIQVEAALAGLGWSPGRRPASPAESRPPGAPTSCSLPPPSSRCWTRPTSPGSPVSVDRRRSPPAQRCPNPEQPGRRRHHGVRISSD